ncbi:single-stranded DNA-binding protein [Macrococcus armenti]|nr:single-stranded DNA-binding protein [Macrococcus armenti]UBH18729.1 single-stranded DNA-binding protein [Macrococcus armenti]UBH21001.1 single-stranded DNA-binding protein [Macrococcus armenti]
MLNRVVLVGRLTKDPEFRTTPSGVSVATFTLAVNRTFTDANGERKADFINCVVFRKQAENVNNFLHKGSQAGVDGRLQTRNYENSEGKKVYVTEVVCDSVQFLEPKASGNGQQQQYQQPQQQVPQQNPFANGAQQQQQQATQQSQRPPQQQYQQQAQQPQQQQYQQNNQYQQPQQQTMSDYQQYPSQQPQQQYQQQQPQQNPFANGAVDINDDDLPF